MRFPDFRFATSGLPPVSYLNLLSCSRKRWGSFDVIRLPRMTRWGCSEFRLPSGGKMMLAPKKMVH